MCGIAGIFIHNNQLIDQSLISKMIEPINYRGPDSQGIWYKENIGLGHVRLSIHDLSTSGHQPMHSHSGKWIIIFNGEIYNYKSLREELKKEFGLHFKSDSDTEVLVNGIEYWGIEKTLKKTIGMFAFCVFDTESKIMYLARDRFGEKPLYYGEQNHTLAFASELKALKPLRELGWNFEVDRDVLATYMRFAYVPTPYSIYKNIYKLEPGSYLKISKNKEVIINSYWSAKSIFKAEKFDGSYNEAVFELENKLIQTLRLQMASDVPLGAFLSGGVDSSTIVALMQSISSKKINTFSIGFHEAEFNEAEYARDVANHLGTYHTDMYVSEKETLEAIPKLPLIYDEPFADSSQVPTFLVSQIAKSKVTVSLSGDAGDEIFGGYNRYFLAQKIKRQILDNGLARFSLSHAPKWSLYFASLLPSKYAQLGDKLFKLKQIVKNSGRSSISLYKQICSLIYNTDFVIGGNEINIFNHNRLKDFDEMSFEEWMMFTDSQTYLLDDILTKVDRAAMAVSLETRVPFLDHNIFEFAWSLPQEFKINQGIGKRILRDVLYKYVPQKLIDRPKMGFGVPIIKWLRHDLKEWANDLLDSQLLKKQGYLDSEIVQNYWQEHLSGKNNWQSSLWNILMFQAWLEKWES